ncbi:MAG: VIT domain-containing protein [Planctomycetota bacterium]
MKRTILTLLIGMAFCLCLMSNNVMTQQPPPPPPPPTPSSPPVQLPQPPDDPKVTEGELKVIDKDGKPVGQCPLKHTDVKAEISGYVARVNVTQQFENPFKEKIEAIYVFPLSSDAAVDDMMMKVGERTIRGQIKKREEARQIYEAAKNAGKVASLLDQERPNIFTQSVANIMPGESVIVTISYVEILKYEDGEYNFVFPMVVGPRYIPGGATGQQGTGWSPDTTQVPDASKITPPVTPEGTRAGHDISVAVSLNAGLPIKRITSKLHEIIIKRSDSPANSGINSVPPQAGKTNESAMQITLKTGKTIPNKDFVLNWEVAGDKIEDAIITTANRGNGFFTLILQPPNRPAKTDISPKEMVFVIDVSGSMRGAPIEKAKETMKLCIEMMNDNDTFNLIAFNPVPTKLFDAPQSNTKENREKGLQFLASKLGSGGTEMLSAALAALTTPPDPNRLRIVCFMTDGYVGNDMQIIDAIQKNLGNARLFSFGVGNSVNRFLLDNMARMGRGEVDYVTLTELGHRAAERFQERIACPLLTDISIDWGGLPVVDIYPQNIPDLFSAKPLVLKGRYTKSAKGEITLKGKIAGKEFSRKIILELPDDNPENGALASLWARARIDDLMSQDLLGIQLGNPKPEIKDQITHLGLEFRLMTQYTSFVAVEEMVITEGGKPKTITVPVEMPEGVSYDGVFGSKDREAMKRGFYGGVRVSTGAYAPSSPSMDMKENGSADAVKPEPKTREEKIKARLDKTLQGLPDKVAKEGKDGNLKLKDFEVKDGKVMVKVYLRDTSAEKIEELKKLGLEIIAEPKAIKMLIARIDVKKLDDLAQFDFVVLVTPAEIK